MLGPTRFAVAAVILALATPAPAAGPDEYAPARVVYDLSSAEPGQLKNVLDRASLLQNLYGGDSFAASIVIVIHEGAIPLLARRGRHYRQDLADRARDLAMGEVIQFRFCRASAKMQGFRDSDFADFIKPVPMADAEIIRLQHAGYAYLH